MLLFLYLYLSFLIIKNLLSFIFWSLAVLVTIVEGKSPVIHKEEALYEGPTARAGLWVMLVYTEILFFRVFIKRHDTPNVRTDTEENIFLCSIWRPL